MADSLVTFLFELANFVVFAILLGWLFVKPVRRFLADQTEREAETRAALEQEKVAAQKLREQAEQEKQDLAKQLEANRTAAIEDVRQESQLLKEHARQEIEQLRQRWEREKTQTWKHEQSLWADRVARVAGRAVTQLLTQVQPSDLRTGLLRSACDQLQHQAGDSLGPVKVESAFPLSSEQRQMIGDAVGRDSGDETLEFHENPALIDGLKIYSNAGLIDHSLEGLAQYAERELRKELSPDD